VNLYITARMRLLCCLVAFTFKADSHIIYMQVIIGQAAVQRCNANVNFHDEEKPLYPPTINNDDLHKFFVDVAGNLLGINKANTDANRHGR